MKKLSQIALTVALSTALITPVLAQNAAVVNGKSIPKAKLDKMLESTGQANNPELRERARDMLITRELISQEAMNRGVIANPAIQDQLEEARLNILVGAVFDDYIKRDGVSDSELKAAYDQVKGQFEGKEYKVRHILVEKEAEAKSILAKLKAGEKFEDLAKANSKDPGSAVKGGDLDWMSPQSLVPEFSKAMVALPKGQLTEKPVKTQYGFHIIRVDDVRESKVPTMAELKPQLIDMMNQDQNWQRAKFNEMITKLKAKANSKDPGSAVKGGDLDWMSPQSLVPEFSKAMVALPKGQLTEKPIKTQYGFHIIRVDDVRESKVPTMAELKPQLIDMMNQDQNWQRAKFNEMITKLKAKAKVK